MNTIWILVCDSASARLFEVRGNEASWHVVSAVSRDESRRASALPLDPSAPAASPDVETEHFARSLAEMLDQAMRSARLRRWVLVAAPDFIELIKKELTPDLAKHLMATVDEDMSHLYVRELAERLRDTVRVPMSERDMTPLRMSIDQKYTTG